MDDQGDPRNSDPASPVDESKPSITRKRSGLNYDEELALPMPKPRPRREPPIDENPKKGAEDPQPRSHPRLQKKKSMPDTTHARATADPGTSLDGKKKSRLEAIKSKLSFKDLRKEASKDDGRIPAVPRMPTFDKQNASQRSASGSGTMAFSPSIYNFQARSKQTLMANSSAVPMTSPASATQHNTAPSRLPLAPSGTYTHAHGSMTPSKASTSQRVDSWGRVKTATECVESKETPAAATQRSVPVPVGKHSPNVLGARPNPGASATKRSLPTSPALDYPPTGDSPPTLRDLTEGSGKVKYLPRGWLETSTPSTPSPTVKSTRPGPTPYPESGPSSDQLPNFMPGLEERLEKIGLSLDKPTPPGIKNLSIDSHAKDVLDMLRAFQRRTDLGITGLNQKLDDLEQWLNDQLKTKIASVSDLERTSKELHCQQIAISSELRKFNLDIHIEMSVMDRRMSVVESKLLDEMETEITSLALSIQEMTQKTEEAIERFSAQSDKAAKMAEEQQAKIKEMEDELGELVKRQANRITSQPSPTKIPRSPRLARPSFSESATSTSTEPSIKLPRSPEFSRASIGGSTTPTSTEPLIKPPEPPLPPVRVSPLPRSVTAIPPRHREATKAKDKNDSSFKRSLSIKKGLADIVTSDSDAQSKPHKRVGSNDESKKWNIFGFRRRGTSNESTNSNNNGSNKFGWLPSRRSRDGRASDNGSSRSVTPPPPVPRKILQNIENNIHAASQVHPAFRNMIQQTVMQDESLSSPSTPSTPIAPMPARMGSQIACTDTQHMGVITASVAPSLASSHEHRGASRELLSPGLHKRTPESFNHSPKSPMAIRSIEDMRRPLLYCGEEEHHEWDHCSLHEVKSTASLR
ncbi:hypothetical protein PENSUB_2482 [Penicillium subrubescens]|uniref:Uncharacterized protein n=1 Tax=Penicillium subrubescens TaxID=1316194 RepID=A0A1Q5UHH4_9EURO|nr:hypothetical protein PENSUB_2482 [Penicillium subrubescens]